MSKKNELDPETENVLKQVSYAVNSYHISLSLKLLAYVCLKCVMVEKVYVVKYDPWFHAARACSVVASFHD